MMDKIHDPFVIVIFVGLNYHMLLHRFNHLCRMVNHTRRTKIVYTWYVFWLQQNIIEKERKTERVSERMRERERTRAIVLYIYIFHWFRASRLSFSFASKCCWAAVYFATYRGHISDIYGDVGRVQESLYISCIYIPALYCIIIKEYTQTGTLQVSRMRVCMRV